MRSLAWALTAFAVSFLAQLLIWRVRRPAGHYAAIGAISLATLLTALGGLYMLGGPSTALDYINFTTLYVALILAYVTTYSAVQADSPTMVILLRIEQAGPRGVTREELLMELTNQILVTPRVEDLVASRLATLRDGRYIIGPRGVLMARIHMLFRRLLGMQKGG